METPFRILQEPVPAGPALLEERAVLVAKIAAYLWRTLRGVFTP